MVDNEKQLTPRQRARRKAILDAVRLQLAEDGYEGLSMRKVAEQASVSPSTLYEIYQSKEHLILYSIAESIRNLGLEEDQYEPGLERFLHRLESIASFFVSDADTGLAVAKVFLRADKDSPANEVFLVNAIEARKTSLLEMKEMKQLKRGIDVEFLSRTLVALTWGTAILWARGFITSAGFQGELIRGSMSLVQPQVSRSAAKRVAEIIDLYTPAELHEH
ncbi:TetR/AcrR family transcriptional regulator [Haliea sp. E17]|uniref:TetR/AcrR family transcriptional regulator n=1 Tax=Haliea sp. E17 TaxID=3401576 RepID=UPI003AAB3A66